MLYRQNLEVLLVAKKGVDGGIISDKTEKESSHERDFVVGYLHMLRSVALSDILPDDVKKEATAIL